jgi:drug/metabolite transporter (DMT)-like permease
MSAPGGGRIRRTPLVVLLLLVDCVDPFHALVLPRTNARLCHAKVSACGGPAMVVLSRRRTPRACSSTRPGWPHRQGSPRTSTSTTSLAIDPWNDDRSIPIVLEGELRRIGGAPTAATEEEASSTTTSTATASSSSSSSWINANTAILWLNAVAILWGTQHAVIKTVVTDDESSAAAFTLCRFALAAALALPAGITQVVNRKQAVEDDASLLSSVRADAAAAAATTTLQSTNTTTDWVTLARWGAELGWWMFLGFGFQAIGLETTTAQKSGFLLYLNVKLVPLFAWGGLGRSISRATWISAAAAFLGTTLLGGLWEPVLGGLAASSSLTDAQRWNVGDVWSLAAAAASAMFILRLEFASRALPQQAAALNAASLVAVTVLATAWTLAVDPATDLLPTLSHLLTTHAWEFLYLAGVTTALANGIQTAAQAHVPAERASLIYAMDPVYGAFFAYLWLGESLPGVAGWIGATLVATAAASNAWLDLKPAPETEEDASRLEASPSSKDS